MKATPIKIIQYNVTEGEQTWRVEFIPVNNTPGFSHRIAINKQLTKSWLGDEFRPNGEAAIYFVKKHSEAIPAI